MKRSISILATLSIVISSLASDYIAVANTKESGKEKVNVVIQNDNLNHNFSCILSPVNKTLSLTKNQKFVGWSGEVETNQPLTLTDKDTSLNINVSKTDIFSVLHPKSNFYTPSKDNSLFLRADKGWLATSERDQKVDFCYKSSSFDVFDDESVLVSNKLDSIKSGWNIQSDNKNNYIITKVIHDNRFVLVSDKKNQLKLVLKDEMEDNHQNPIIFKYKDNKLYNHVVNLKLKVYEMDNHPTYMVQTSQFYNKNKSSESSDDSHRDTLDHASKASILKESSTTRKAVSNIKNKGSNFDHSGNDSVMSRGLKQEGQIVKERDLKTSDTNKDSREIVQSNFYNDVPAARNNILGAAGYFTVFSEYAHFKTHFNGNAATNLLDNPDSAMGTNNLIDKEIFYFKNIRAINSNIGIDKSNHNKVVVGQGVSINLNNFNEPLIQNVRMNHLKANEIYQEEKISYLNISDELNKLRALSGNISDSPMVKVYTSKDFSDRNNRVIDISHFKGPNVFIQVSPEVLKMDTPLTIKGLEKAPNNKRVYITIDGNNTSTLDINSKIILKYSDGTVRNNHETTNFKDSTLLWNFKSSSNQKIIIHSPFQGSILAPNSDIDGTNVNIDGNIICQKLLGAGEIHRWDFQSTNLDGVDFFLYKEDDLHKPLANAEFKLTSISNPERVYLAKTDKNGMFKFNKIPYGDYILEETKAPEGYKLNSEKYRIKISSQGVSVANGDNNISIKNNNEIHVINHPQGGPILPDTGGGGIKLYLTTGIIFIGFGSIILIYTNGKRRKIR